MSRKGMSGAAIGAILCSVLLPLARTADSVKSFTPQQRRWWAFQTVVKPPIPAVKNRTWVKNDIDSFILGRLEEKNLTAAPAADTASSTPRRSHGSAPTVRSSA